MKNMFKTAIAALGIFGIAATANAADAAKNEEGSWLKLGTLTCHVDPSVGLLIGSAKSAECIFNGVDGQQAIYEANMMRIGVDVGITKSQTFVWVVLAPGKTSRTSLEGSYVGASAEVTAVVGASANVLVGGFKKSIALQPVSVGMQAGLNVAAGVTTLTLDALR